MLETLLLKLVDLFFQKEAHSTKVTINIVNVNNNSEKKNLSSK